MISCLLAIETVTIILFFFKKLSHLDLKILIQFMRKTLILLLWLIKCTFLYPLLTPRPIVAQVIPDSGSIKSNVRQEGNTSTITGGKQAGSNLFHSFGKFSIPTDNIVYFKNGPDIRNILIRVTGSSESTIDGLFLANGSANLFLINPNGISFGPNARLNIGGSFISSTANNIKFADGTNFGVELTEKEPLLTVSVPVGLGFGNNPESIRVSGDGKGIRTNSDLVDTTFGLRVRPNQTLALVGGDLIFSGATLKTAGGRIELGSVEGENLVNLVPINKGWQLGYSGVSGFGNIQLSQATAVDASGAGGGDIQVQGKDLTLLDGSQIEAATLGARSGGKLIVNTSNSVRLVGLPNSTSFTNTGISNEVYEKATGNAGSLQINTKHLNVRDGAFVAAGTSGIGNAGSVEISSDSVELSRTSTNRSSSSISSVAEPGSTGNGGDTKIETKRLSIRSGGVVSSGTFGQGVGGNVFLKASESVEVIGRSLNDNSPGRISSRTAGTGKGGNLTLETGRLDVSNGATINVGSNQLPGRVNLGAGQGDAGTLRVNAKRINLNNKGSITAASASGEGGNISLLTRDLRILQNSEITTTAGGTGNGGDITINGEVIALLKDSSITANAFEGNGGNIEVNGTGLFVSRDSKITATSERGVDGVVDINVPDNDLDAANKITPGFALRKLPLICGTDGDAAEGSFVEIGKGGIHADIEDPLSVRFGWYDDSDYQSDEKAKDNSSKKIKESENIEIVEAQGWIDNGDGTVSFTADPPPDEVVVSDPLSKSGCTSK